MYDTSEYLGESIWTVNTSNLALVLTGRVGIGTLSRHGGCHVSVPAVEGTLPVLLQKVRPV